MILIFSSKLSGDDEAAGLLSQKIRTIGSDVVLINPHSDLSKIALLQKGRKLELLVDGKPCFPRVVYVATPWRCDAIINAEKYPNSLRSRTQQFLQDIRFAFEDVTWLPGKYESIERADSKPGLMRLAGQDGLKTPLFTLNAHTPGDVKVESGVYQKHLGPPFVVSINTEKGIEVGVTTTNLFHSDSKTIRLEKQPWQWQQPIHSVAQVRCFVVDERVWAVRWEHDPSQDGIWDYRYANEVKELPVRWYPYELPHATAEALLCLMQKLKLRIASPEFLITSNGNHVFIDMNPCGDWFGFFSAEDNQEIIETLARLLVSRPRV